MAASAAQPTVVRRESRIIERPRLIKLLDETDARTILLLAPAGYGKTTLARQWAKTLNGAVWVTLTAAHTDVASQPKLQTPSTEVKAPRHGRSASTYMPVPTRNALHANSGLY